MSKETENSSVETEIEIPESDVTTKIDSTEVDELTQMKELVAQWEDKYLRAHADFENSKRLLAKDKAMAVTYANESFASDILSVIDSLESAISMIESVEDKGNNEFVTKMKEGLRLTDDQIHKVLEKHHIKLVECEKEYDPNLHQAIMQVESDAHESGDIVQVLQKGYTIKERVLRPAMVSTAK
jgi:molecular chaperone GrpE